MLFYCSESIIQHKGTTLTRHQCCGVAQRMSFACRTFVCPSVSALTEWFLSRLPFLWLLLRCLETKNTLISSTSLDFFHPLVLLSQESWLSIFALCQHWPALLILLLLILWESFTVTNFYQWHKNASHVGLERINQLKKNTSVICYSKMMYWFIPISSDNMVLSKSATW